MRRAVLDGLALASAFSLARGLRGYRRERRLLAALPLQPVTEGELSDVARTAALDVVVDWLRSRVPHIS